MDLLESLPLKKRRRIASFTFMLLAAFPGIGAEDKWKKKNFKYERQNRKQLIY